MKFHPIGLNKPHNIILYGEREREGIIKATKNEKLRMLNEELKKSIILRGSEKSSLIDNMKFRI